MISIIQAEGNKALIDFEISIGTRLNIEIDKFKEPEDRLKDIESKLFEELSQILKFKIKTEVKKYLYL
jgi:hypothetical protein